MPHVRAAQVSLQGVDLIMAPMLGAFGRMSARDQNEQVAVMQAAATRSGLVGTVIPIWPAGDRMAFIAPPQWRALIESHIGKDLAANLNVIISW